MSEVSKQDSTQPEIKPTEALVHLFSATRKLSVPAEVHEFYQKCYALLLNVVAAQVSKPDFKVVREPIGEHTDGA